MADFGSMFDKAKADAGEKAQQLRDAAAKLRQEAAHRLEKQIEPLNRIALPVLKDAEAQLKSRDIAVEIDRFQDLKYIRDTRLPTLHFQLRMKHGGQSKVYMFEVKGPQIICTSMSGNAPQRGSGASVSTTPRDSFTASIVEQVISRAISDVVAEIR